jgi:hypothetical protein
MPAYCFASSSFSAPPERILAYSFPWGAFHCGVQPRLEKQAENRVKRTASIIGFDHRQADRAGFVARQLQQDELKWMR